MNVNILLPVFVMLLGLVVYLVAAGKAMELGRLAFFAGLLVALLVLSNHALKISA